MIIGTRFDIARDRCDYCGLYFTNLNRRNYVTTEIKNRYPSKTVDWCESCAESLPKTLADAKTFHGEE